MPTSSQALILLTTDGRTPAQQVIHRTFPLCSVPYPLTSHDINAKCVQLDDQSDDVMGDMSVSRQTRIKFGDVLSSLPDLLTIKGYQGALAYDAHSKVMKWKIDTEVPSSRMEAFITYRGDPAFKPDYFRDEKVRLPSIYDNEDEVDGDNKLDGTQTCRYTRNVWRPPSEQIDKMPVSFPSLIKTAIDQETYERLCNLGFRPEGNGKSNPTMKNGVQSKPNGKHETLQAWASPEDYQENDFRLEDLNLRPNGKNAYHLKMSQLRRDGGTLPFPDTMQPVTLPGHARSVTFSDQAHDGVAVGKTVYIPSQEASETCMQSTEVSGTYNGHGSSSMKDYMSERNKFFSKYGKYTTDVVAEESDDVIIESSNDRRLPAIETGYKKEQSSTSDISTITPEPEVQPFKSKRLSLMDNVKSMANYNKWKKQKLTRLRLRKEVPVPQPLSVCFSFRDNAKSHSQVKDIVEKQIGSSITRLQFDPISVHALDNHAKSRWVVTLADKETRDYLLSNGLFVDGEKTEVRNLDELMREEVEAYKLYEMVQKGQISMPTVSIRRVKVRQCARIT
ncbi:uncharacterized protein LOC110447706 [Mizuhopecten yessoensis]|nr:uncharacterized protein LOC110447706 [Mizuhopecten yessoensis]XP_021349241.1 uncharacterized protein LOC110447706 [Mizuhopecten yessoensis]XP_021349243.1 uncharacterized protein LOC110447706 [Mizuhopecten yessoensis]XP_021349244.1 uncharacterized protein LOC110447706 [Mizuhopecten yessoensis]XP_021349245.1 uncharacterized protein LOC110447706 [Mizuhopecten yessoensis]XP_021349246.1 uncharacterized protein LOC110447706 [Mizuhopecten yessoensis]